MGVRRGGQGSLDSLDSTGIGKRWPGFTTKFNIFTKTKCG